MDSVFAKYRMLKGSVWGQKLDQFYCSKRGKTLTELDAEGENITDSCNGKSNRGSCLCDNPDTKLIH